MNAGALPQIGDALMERFVALDFLPTQATPQVVIPLGADEEE